MHWALNWVSLYAKTLIPINYLLPCIFQRILSFTNSKLNLRQLFGPQLFGHCTGFSLKATFQTVIVSVCKERGAQIENSCFKYCAVQEHVTKLFFASVT
jgi:hypothetical protein